MKKTYLVLRRVPYESFVVGEGDVGRSGAVALVVRDDLDAVFVTRRERRGRVRTSSCRGWGERKKSFVVAFMQVGHGPLVLPNPNAGVRGTQVDADGDVFVRGHVDGVASVGGARVEMGGLRLRRSSFVFSQKPKISEKITKSHDTDQDVGCAQKRSARGFVAREE